MTEQQESFGNLVDLDDSLHQRELTTPKPPRVAFQHQDSSGSLTSNARTLLYSPNLRSNLTRELNNRDPFFYYELVETLGIGSMGAVVRVRKRGETVGGSARKEMQEAVRRQKRNQDCFQIPFIGGLFRLCLDGELKLKGSSSKNAMLAPAKSSSMESPSNDSLEDTSLSGAGSIRTTGSQPSEYANTYAMKSIHLNRITDQSFLTELRNEIGILRKLDHPHIVRAIETYEHRQRIYIVMEICSGGDLYSRDPYTEEQAARIVTSILSAIAYMHSRQILHRDLKYENVLFVNQSPNSPIKLIDFGLSKTYGDNPELTAGVGTIYTMAPEVLQGKYTEKADVWSVGVLAFMLLSSQMPFYGRKKNHIVEQILNCQYDFRGRRWKRISSQAKAFIDELLVLDPEERMDAHTALSCTWLNRRFSATTRGPDAEEENMARHAMLRYAGYTKLKKMALMVVAHKSSTDEIGILRKVFQKYDKKKDGSICYEDFCSALSEFGHSEDDLKEMFDAVDLDGTGRIRYTEFLAATIEAQGAISEERLAEAFDRLDSDDSGYISAANLIELLGHDFPKEEIDQIIADADLTKDNQISYAEFLALWEDKAEHDRAEQLRLLGTEVIANVASLTEMTMNSFRGNLSLKECSSDLESASARADFLQKKRESVKNVSFKESVIHIPAA
eukprot:Nitzschia sp. Nitz4//scaffold133_size116822//66538//68818//NITZ4_003809-RA/size116822-snap-gene-0.5-mRNA-1//1//CDS//3329535402//490//frame0